MSTSAADGSTAQAPPTCHGGLENLDEEFDYNIDDVEGSLPSDLEGTFFRNGPGRQRIGGETYGHWFDGDGMISRFTFKEGAAHFKNAYVRTPKYVKETEEQKILYRGFGTQIPGGLKANFLKQPANPANTNTIYHGGHLLAVNEGGKPWELEPSTLKTIGEFDYQGALGKMQVFSAHGKVHPGTGDLFNFGVDFDGFGLRGPKPCLSMHRIDPSGAMKRQNRLPLDTFPFCHDFAITEKYAVFFVNSIVFDGMLSFLLGRKTISDVVRFDDKRPMRILVVDLDTLEPVKTFECAPGAIIHFGNAFEEGSEIVLDGMYASDFDANEVLQDVFNPAGRFNGGTYNRYRLDLASGEISVQQVCEHESEFPTFNTSLAGQRHGACYTACSIDNGANSFFNAFQRVSYDGDSTLVTLPPGMYGSEPLFAPAKDARAEDDGYLLEVVYDGFKHKSELQIYRADTVEHCCTMKLRHHLPHQFHGHFTPDVFI